ncbi:MAG: metal-dependent transcriptional regulator [Clostridiales Family XIII bacterium]|jgi:Mn-dependent DtxR family transcriptional regulator|nr:metal-dependent transcriptional regulator [Clostridiales Family XIII bacterium]
MIKESGENYLETILLLSERNDIVRSIDVATELGFSKPSVSRAMGILRDEGYIKIEETGHIYLTEKGKARAANVLARHNLFNDFLHKILGVDKEVAAEDACKLEHALSEESFSKMQDWMASQIC